MTADQRAELIRTLTAAQAGGLTAYGEARNQPISGVLGVLSVIRNRVGLGKVRWGSTWASVVLADRQFSCWNDGDPNCAVLYDIAQQWKAQAVINNPVLDACVFLAAGVVSGTYVSNVQAATHYFAPKVVATPEWAIAPGARRVTIIADHAFYAGVRA